MATNLVTDEALASLAEGVRQDMMLAMLGAFQSVAAACADVCLQRLHELHRDLVTLVDREVQDAVAKSTCDGFESGTLVLQALAARLGPKLQLRQFGQPANDIVEPSITELDANEDDGLRCSNDGIIALETMYKNLDDGKPVAQSEDELEGELTAKLSAMEAKRAAPGEPLGRVVEDTFELTEDSSVGSGCCEVACSVSQEAISVHCIDAFPQEEINDQSNAYQRGGSVESPSVAQTGTETHMAEEEETSKGAWIATAVENLDKPLQLKATASRASRKSSEGDESLEDRRDLQNCLQAACAYSIAGTWDDGELHDMSWDSAACRFTFRAVLSQRTSASFRILPGGDRRKPLRLRYPGSQKTSRNRSGETVWTINSDNGPSDGVDEDCCYVIELALAADGTPSSVNWTPAPCMDSRDELQNALASAGQQSKKGLKAISAKRTNDVGEAEVAAALSASTRPAQTLTTTPPKRLEDPEAVRKELAELEAFLCHGPRMSRRC